MARAGRSERFLISVNEVVMRSLSIMTVLLLAMFSVGCASTPDQQNSQSNAVSELDNSAKCKVKIVANTHRRVKVC